MLNHENIVKYYESFIHKNKFCIIMEYADGGIKTNKDYIT
jgi:serine/threonine protein kinase